MLEVYGFVILYEYLLCQDLSVATKLFYPMSLTLEFGLRFENFKLVNYFLTVSARAFILHVNISSDKKFLLVSRYLSL